MLMILDRLEDIWVSCSRMIGRSLPVFRVPRKRKRAAATFLDEWVYASGIVSSILETVQQLGRRLIAELLEAGQVRAPVGGRVRSLAFPGWRWGVWFVWFPGPPGHIGRLEDGGLGDCVIPPCHHRLDIGGYDE